MFYDFRHRLSTEVGSGADTCPMSLDLASRLRRALVLPVCYGSGPRLPGEVGSGAVTCHMALDLSS
jgi:hypothetical protein